MVTTPDPFPTVQQWRRNSLYDLDGETPLCPSCGSPLGIREAMYNVSGIDQWTCDADLPARIETGPSTVDSRDCESCLGTGKVPVNEPAAYGYIPCDACDGAGKICTECGRPMPDDACSHCAADQESGARFVATYGMPRGIDNE